MVEEIEIDDEDRMYYEGLLVEEEQSGYKMF